MSELRQNDYIYAAARIAALERSILSQEQYDKLIFAPAGAERQMLLSFGYSGDERKNLPEMLDIRMKEAFDTVCETVKDPSVFDALRYPYDCLNLKAVIKCMFRSGFRPDDFLSELGTVPPEKAKSSLRENDFSLYPTHMAKAAVQAMETYPKTSDPADIDMPLDAACFADMREAALRSGIPELLEYTARRIDILNVIICARLWGTDIRRFGAAFLVGGSVTRERLAACFSAGVFTSDAFRGTLLESAVEEILSAKNAAELERVLDRFEMRQIAPYKTSYFGGARLVGYLLAYEAEVRNLRLIFAGRIAGDAGEKIKERLRAVYV